MVNFEGEVKRSDLYLRTAYVDMETVIYKVADFDYFIYSEQFPEDFEEFQKKFSREIKFIGTPVRLTYEPIKIFEAIIPPISDQDISKDFAGVPMTLIDLYNLLLIKFPDVNIYKIEGAQPIIIRVYAYDEKTEMRTESHSISKEQRSRLMGFLTNLRVATNFEIIEDKVTIPPSLDRTLVHNPVQFLNANKLWNKNTGLFSDRDEALWFDNIDAIYEGKFKKDNLYFYNSDNYVCYIDYTGGDHIDIRNFLLLYQTIYITPPYEKNIKKWLANQRITEQEFLGLVEKGRIKIVLTQPEFRYEMGLFKEMYQIAPDSVITRRAIAALQQIDIVEISDNYLFKEPSQLREIKRFCEAAAPLLGHNPKDYFEMLTWPIQARRESFEVLYRKGSFGTAVYGVNNFVSKIIEKKIGKNLNFEFTVSAANIHFAHALNATYYPYQATHNFSDAFYAHMMGIYLNMYKLSTQEHLSLLSKTNEELPVTPVQLNPIDVIEIDNYLPILEFDKILEQNRFYPSGKRLMETLAPLSVEQRQEKIKKYNELVDQRLKQKESKEFKIDFATNLTLDGVGAVSHLLGLGTVYTLLRQGGKALIKVLPGFKNITNQLEDMYYKDIDKANVHFLTRINRVARVKKF